MNKNWCKSVGLAFALAFGFVGFMFAITSSDNSRFTPEYWHYRYHDSLVDAKKVCDDGCRFLSSPEELGSRVGVGGRIEDE